MNNSPKKIVYTYDIDFDLIRTREYHDDQSEPALQSYTNKEWTDLLYMIRSQALPVEVVSVLDEYFRT